MRRAQLRSYAVGCAALFCVLFAVPCQAGVFRYCDPPAELDATQQDTILRFAAVIKSTLDRTGNTLALVARSGLDLSRFGLRYSHAGFSLRSNPNGPWSVRQLYYDCDERKPRIFDQGISGFVVGAGDPSIGYFSVVLLPGAEADIERIVQDNRQALRLLGGRYSANAYPYALRYQNCNQWVAEVLSVAWGGLAGLPADDDLRAQAQAWLRERSYAPTRFEVGNPVLMWLGGVLPWLHRDDHPREDLDAWRFQVSMPASIEAFVRTRVPQARRLEFCHANRRIVIREGWEPIAEGCVAGPHDTVIPLDL